MADFNVHCKVLSIFYLSKWRGEYIKNFTVLTGEGELMFVRFTLVVDW